MQATLQRGSTSVDIDIVGEGGEPVVSWDVGKPNADEQRSGRIDPRVSDFWSGLRQVTLQGELPLSSAHADALTLAEELVKPPNDGNPLELDLSSLPQHGTFEVAPLQNALTLTYPEGTNSVVQVGLSLPVVSKTDGNTASIASTSTTAGSGPIKLSRGGTSVTFDKALELERSVGRPQSVVRRAPNQDDPRYIDKRKSATDEFSFSAVFKGSNANSDAVTLRDDIILSPLQRETLTLDFQGYYGLGSYEVFPFGSAPVRTQFQAGDKDVVVVPDITLRVVDNS